MALTPSGSRTSALADLVARTQVDAVQLANQAYFGLGYIELCCELNQ
jgi:hypothetical protein